MRPFTSRGVTLVELLGVVAIVGVLASIAIPQYQVYVLRSQVQRVVAESGAIKPAVEVCLADGKTNVGNPATSGNCDPQATGSNLQAAGGNAAPSAAGTLSSTGFGVPQVTLSGIVPSTIVATFGNVSGLPLQSPVAGTITWTRDVNGIWTCKAANIDPRLASTSCPL